MTLREEWITRAENVTSGGSQTRSKGYLSFPGTITPFVEEGYQSRVLTVEGSELIDLLIGMGASVFGHGHPSIVQAVQGSVPRGTLFGFPHKKEIEVSEMFADAFGFPSVRWVKTGSEACSGAMRIARIATKREKILTSDHSYHGWHDGFTASKPDAPGIPEGLRKSIGVFKYNDFADFDRQFDKELPAAVMMEPALYTHPEPNFLEHIRFRTMNSGVLLIFDEMLLGGRVCLRGGSEFFGVEPDLAVYGKGIGAGVPVACIVGSRELMAHADVVSGTYGGDVIGLSAVEAVMNMWENNGPYYDMNKNPGAILRKNGYTLQEIFKTVFQKSGIRVSIQGFPSIFRLKFNHDWGLQMASLFAETMLDNGVLIHPAVIYVNTAMTDADFEKISYATVESVRVLKEKISSREISDYPITPCLSTGTRPQGG